jgi:hypothetical protein
MAHNAENPDNKVDLIKRGVDVDERPTIDPAVVEKKRKWGLKALALGTVACLGATGAALVIKHYPQFDSNNCDNLTRAQVDKPQGWVSEHSREWNGQHVYKNITDLANRESADRGYLMKPTDVLNANLNAPIDPHASAADRAEAEATKAMYRRMGLNGAFEKSITCVVLSLPEDVQRVGSYILVKANNPGKKALTQLFQGAKDQEQALVSAVAGANHEAFAASGGELPETGEFVLNPQKIQDSLSHVPRLNPANITFTMQQIAALGT